MKKILKFEKETHDIKENDHYSVSEITKVAKEYAGYFGVPFDSITFEFDATSGYDSCDLEVTVRGYRPETDEEEFAREEKERIAKIKAEEAERKKAEDREKRDLAEFARLKAKYEARS